jgi:DNA processing protein
MRLLRVTACYSGVPGPGESPLKSGHGRPFGHWAIDVSAPTLEPSPDCPLFDASTASGALRDELADWIQLQAAYFLEPGLAVQLLSSARGLSSGGLSTARVLSSALAQQDQAHRRARLSQRDLEERLSLLGELHVRALPIFSLAYPARLRALVDAAPLLLVRGDPRVLSARGVAIVGARAATGYGLDVAGQLSRALAAAGLVVISGLARGIDAAAHRAALEVDGLTVAFSACGPERIYPAEHRSLASEIATRGAVVTEMPPGTPPRPPYFPMRNRLIAGLAEVVVVVEARPRSGSLVTARLALEQGREVMAVPGPITRPTSQGVNALLRDGAAPVLGPEDVLRALGMAETPLNATARGASVDAGPERGTHAAAILESLAARPAARDALCALLGLSPSEIAESLVELELSGRVRLDRDGCLHATRPR